MKLARFARMSPPRQNAALIAIQVHNALEAVYADSLSADRLRALNQTVHHALYAAIALLEAESRKPGGTHTVDRLIEQVPDEWDVSDDGPQDASR